MKKVKEGDIFELRVRPTIIPTATTPKVEKKAQFPSRSQPVCTLLQDTLHCSGSRTRPKLKSRGADSASAAYRRLIKAAVQTEEAGLTYCFCLLCTQPPPPPSSSISSHQELRQQLSACPSPPATAPEVCFPYIAVVIMFIQHT